MFRRILTALLLAAAILCTAAPAVYAETEAETPIEATTEEEYSLIISGVRRNPVGAIMIFGIGITMLVLVFIGHSKKKKAGLVEEIHQPFLNDKYRMRYPERVEKIEAAMAQGIKIDDKFIKQLIKEEQAELRAAAAAKREARKKKGGPITMREESEEEKKPPVSIAAAAALPTDRAEASVEEKPALPEMAEAEETSQERPDEA